MGDKVAVNDRLDLGGVTSGNVGNGPAGLLSNRVLRRSQKLQKSGQGTGVNDNLGLDVITSDNVTNGSQSRGLDRCALVAEELNESSGIPASTTA